MRNSDWTIIGIDEWWGGWDTFSYRLCFFGFELRFWFRREVYKTGGKK